MNEPKRIALVGNPNCGKSTLFNLLTGGSEYVGNRPGVTVAAKEGFLKDFDNIILADTPGVYSLSPFSPDEKATASYLENEKIDAIINLTDSRNLRRGLFLTTQVVELGIPTVIMLNSFGKGEGVDSDTLEAFFETDTFSVNAKSGENVSDAVKKAVSLIGSKIKTNQICNFKSDDEEEITARYKFVDEAISFCKTENESRNQISRKIDKIVLNKFLAFPIFFALVFLVYFVSVSLVGSGVSSALEKMASENISPFVINTLQSLNCVTWLCSLVQNALLTSTFTVLSFLPQIFMLFFSLTLLEESGYMARAAFITDAVFKNSGLSGKSLISFFVGTSCSVTGIMSARTIENRKMRNLTVMLTPFMPCSAKVTVIALIAGRNFGGSKLTLFFVFLFAGLSIIFSAKLLKNHRYFKQDSTFLLEIPPYSMPSLLYAVKRALKQSLGFVKKAVAVIMLSSIILWALSYFRFEDLHFSVSDKFESSLLGVVGEKISPFFMPLGFGNAECTAAVISGLFAKENVIGTLSMFSSSLFEMSTAQAISFLAFNLFCPPCIVAVSTMKKELGSLRLTAFALLYQLLFAYLLSLVLNFLLGLLV